MATRPSPGLPGVRSKVLGSKVLKSKVLKSKVTVRFILLSVICAMLIVGCGGSSDSAESVGPVADPEADKAGSVSEVSPGVRLVSAADGAAIQEDPPADLVILDIRTPEEFADGHLEGATMLDFYEPDFAERLADLDPDQSYLLYCRSGNRSEQAAALMEQLGFHDVAEVEGGIVAWSADGLPVVR